MKTAKLLIILGVIFALGLLIYFPGRKKARAHVNSKTAVTDHPLSCISCHIYTSQNKWIKKIINEDYKVMLAKKFQRKLPRETSFILKIQKMQMNSITTLIKIQFKRYLSRF